MGTGSTPTLRRIGSPRGGDDAVSARSVPLLLAAALLLAACAGPTVGDGWRFFGAPGREGDLWYEVVSEWQVREREQAPDTRLPKEGLARDNPPPSALLRVKMGRWRAQERLALARRVAEWAQVESRRHYRVDPPTSQAEDPWPTTRDLLDANGDDCDGLDLIVYRLLREFGFPRGSIYRAVVRRDRDGENHMVTLWFQDPADPWVIDATAAVTKEVRRFSQIPAGWTPTKVFDEHEQFTPTSGGGGIVRAAR